MGLLQPIAPAVSLPDQTFQRIVAAIASGELAPGDSLREATLARAMGISRGTLRAALDRLIAHGVLVRERNLGVRVIDVTPADLDDLFAIREALEGMCARQAAIRITDEEVDALESVIDSRAIQPGEDESTTHDFHVRVLRAARNRRLSEMLTGPIYYNLHVYRLASAYTPTRGEAAMREHVDIVEALRSHDADRAEHLMRAHIRHARDVYEPVISDSRGSSRRDRAVQGDAQ